MRSLSRLARSDCDSPIGDERTGRARTVFAVLRAASGLAGIEMPGAAGAFFAAPVPVGAVARPEAGRAEADATFVAPAELGLRVASAPISRPRLRRAAPPSGFLSGKRIARARPARETSGGD